MSKFPSLSAHGPLEPEPQSHSLRRGIPLLDPACSERGMPPWGTPKPSHFRSGLHTARSAETQILAWAPSSWAISPQQGLHHQVATALVSSSSYLQATHYTQRPLSVSLRRIITPNVHYCPALLLQPPPGRNWSFHSLLEKVSVTFCSWMNIRIHFTFTPCFITKHTLILFHHLLLP